MIEIGLALAATKKAFDIIQSAIDTGQQASGLMDQLGDFYDAKDRVVEAKEDHQRKPNGSYGEQSVESYALKIIQAEIACNDYESKIKKMFMTQGKTPLYQKMLRIRTEERNRRAEAQRKLLNLRREKIRRQQEIKNVAILFLVLSVCAGSAMYISTVLLAG